MLKGGREAELESTLQVLLQDIPPGGWQWHGSVQASDLQDTTCGQVEALPTGCSDVIWDAALERKGDCYHMFGEWRLQTRRKCSRCNNIAEITLSGKVMRDFRMRICAERDEDILPLPGRLNLLDVLREEIWLAWPQRVLCSPECRGLCPHCGADLNRASCGCDMDDDAHPFAALKKLKLKEPGGRPDP